MTRRLDIFEDDDEDRDCVPHGLWGDDLVTLQHVAAQVKKLQQQVDTLISAFSMSIDLQHKLLQQLGTQTSSHSQRPDTGSQPMYTSTPTTHIFTKHNRQTAEAYQHSGGNNTGARPRHSTLTATHTLTRYTAQSCPQLPLVNQGYLSSLVPPNFDRGKSIYPEEWVQSASLYKSAVGVI